MEFNELKIPFLNARNLFVSIDLYFVILGYTKSFLMKCVCMYTMTILHCDELVKLFWSFFVNRSFDSSKWTSSAKLKSFVQSLGVVQKWCHGIRGRVHQRFCDNNIKALVPKSVENGGRDSQKFRDVIYEWIEPFSRKWQKWFSYNEKVLGAAIKKSICYLSEFHAVGSPHSRNMTFLRSVKQRSILREDKRRS